MQSLPTTNQAYQSKLYYEFAQFYDLVFARIFYRRIASVIRSLAIPPGAKVLELGVGTGLSLGCYPLDCNVVGVDLAPDMLEHAQDKIDHNGWNHLRVMEMDAMDLDFPDAAFDYVMGFHVVSVVPDSSRLMREAQRVLRPGGTLTLINHFRSENPLLSFIDRRLEPVTRHWGWHTLSRKEVFDSLPLEIAKVYKTSRWSLFTIVIAKNGRPENGHEATSAAAVAG
jgi:phosphatidylethanolamine/phosphatidyl-N-methylethanolamine N-methyltransferase